MDRRAVNGMRGFAHRLGKGRVRVYRPDEFLHGAFETQCQHCLRDELRGSWTDHVDTKDFIVSRVGHDLHETIGLARHPCAPEHPERERTNAYIVATRLRLLLGQADAANLGIAVRAAGYVAIVERLHLLAGNPLGHENPFGR